MKILAHTSFIGNTGYANHARSFFCALNKYHTVKVRNLTIGDTWKGYNNHCFDAEPYITDEMKDMMILQTLYEADGSRKDYPIYDYKGDFKPDVNIILMDTHNPYFYDKYDGYTIAFNVWESTRYPKDFFDVLLKFDELWVPTEWQKESVIEQGYPASKVHVVTEGVDVNTFHPALGSFNRDTFKFLLFGRWEYRKSTAEIIRAFGEVFKDTPDVELLCSVENPFPYDGMKTTEERIKFHNVEYPNVRYLKFPPRYEYVKLLQEGHVFVSCARSEGWNLPLIEAMACGIPSIYSDWGGQLQFAKGKGLPVKIKGLIQASIKDEKVDGQFCEPDFEDLKKVMLEVYSNYSYYRSKAIGDAGKIKDEFNWDTVARDASRVLEKKILFVTAGNDAYMPTIEKMVKSLNEFSKHKIAVYGINCVPDFLYPNMFGIHMQQEHYSEHDKWYWKQQACIAAIEKFEDYDRFIWIDGDAVVNYNIDEIQQYFVNLSNYPLSDIHINEEFFAGYIDRDGEHKLQNFGEHLSNLMGVPRSRPFMHVCLFLFNKECKWWFEEVIKTYKSVDLQDYHKYFLWNDETIENVLRWKYGFKKHLPNLNFDTSSYDGDYGNTNETLNHFYRFWLEDGPQNFDRIYGWQSIPEDKSKILWFHGNKITDISEKMIEFIKYQRDKSFHQSHAFFTDIYHLKNFDDIWELPGTTMDIAGKYGWHHAVFHEIYNLRDYYHNRIKRINNGDIVVDCGANIGVFTRWAYSEGASKVLSFEPDKRYFKCLKLNADPRTILFNAAVSDQIGTITLYEAEHFGGSNIFDVPGHTNQYTVRTYTLNYLFETGLIDHIDFLKIDTEGAEINILNGISDENLMKVKNIAMEYHHSHLGYNEELRHNFITRLNRLGFNSYLLFLGTNNALQMIYFWR